MQKKLLAVVENLSPEAWEGTGRVKVSWNSLETCTGPWHQVRSSSRACRDHGEPQAGRQPVPTLIMEVRNETRQRCCGKEKLTSHMVRKQMPSRCLSLFH